MIPASATANTFIPPRVNESESSVPAPAAPAQENRPASDWAVGGRTAASIKALATTALLTVIPILKKAGVPNAGAYGLAAPLGQAVGAGLSRLLPPGSQELAVAPEHEGSLRKAKFGTTVGAYFGAIVASDQLSKHASSPAAIGGGVAVSLVVGQTVAHLPFVLQQLMGHEVSERDLTRLSAGKTMLAMLLSSVFGALAGGEVDIANAITTSLPASDVEHVPSEVTTYIPVAIAVLTFAALATYAPQLIQNLIAQRNTGGADAADVQNALPRDLEMQDLPGAANAPAEAAQEDRTPSDGLVVHPTIELSSPPSSGTGARVDTTALNQI